MTLVKVITGSGYRFLSHEQAQIMCNDISSNVSTVT